MIFYVVLCIAAAGFVAYPRLSQSLWGDEEYTMSYHVHGHFQRPIHEPPQDWSPEHPDSGAEAFWKVQFNSLDWDQAIWGYHTTNNHFLNSILAKLSLILWQKATGAEPYEFDEASVRAVPFGVGLLSLASLALLLGHLKLRRAAWIAVPLLAIHPWFIRQIAEARGYAFTFCLLPLCLFLGLKAAATAEWKWWLGYAISQFLLLYSWPGMAAQVLVMNLFLLPLTLRSKFTGLAPRFRFSRWAVANLLSVMILIQLIAPCIPQVIEYGAGGEGGPAEKELPPEWHANLGGRFLAGMDWHDYYPTFSENPNYHSITRLASRHGVFIYGVAGCLTIFFAVGMARMALGRESDHRFVLLATLAPVLAIYAFGLMSGLYLFYWYFVFALPLVCAITAHGAATFWRQSLRWLRLSPSTSIPGRLATPAAVFIFLGSFLLFTWEKTRTQREQPVNPLRESVVFTRPGENATSPENLNLFTAHLKMSAMAYDPFSYWLAELTSSSPTDPGLMRLMRWSDQFDQPLYVNVAFTERAVVEFPEIMKWLRNERFFEKIHTFRGLEPQFDREIFVYKGGVFDGLFRRKQGKGMERPKQNAAK